MVAALESTLGSSFGLADRPGLARTGDFALHAAGPFGAAFDFADSDRRFDVAPLLWLAHRFRRPIDSWLIGDYDGWCLPFRIIWPGRPRASPTALELPTGKVFRGNDVACFRNTWRRHRRARPVFVAIKGGNAIAEEAPRRHCSGGVILHTQADAGTFVIDGARHRWAIDLGPDDYDLPGYFDHGAAGGPGQRWQYYRNQAIGHNTLVIDGRNQVPDVRAAILDSNIDKTCKWVVFDLSAAYGQPSGAVRRGAALIGRQVVIVDEVDPVVSGEIVWVMHFSAEPVAVSGPVAHFRVGDDHFVARILEPADAVFELTSPPPPASFVVTDHRELHGRALPPSGMMRVAELPRRDDDGQGRAAGPPIRRLEALWPKGARRMAVLLLPDCRGEGDAAPPIPPLDSWLGRRTVRLARTPRKLARAGRRDPSKYPGKLADLDRYRSDNLTGTASHV
jgi:hypothetical protein